MHAWIVVRGNELALRYGESKQNEWIGEYCNVSKSLHSSASFNIKTALENTNVEDYETHSNLDNSSLCIKSVLTFRERDQSQSSIIYLFFSFLGSSILKDTA